MTGRWRIRHKLMLGLGLVVAVMGLLLVGTLIGLLSYSNTMKSVASKVAEQSRAEDLRTLVASLSSRTEGSTNPKKESDAILERCQLAQKALAAYEAQLGDTLRRRRDPNQGQMELGLVSDIRREIGELEAALHGATQAVAEADGASKSVLEDSEVKKAIDSLVRASDQLRLQLYEDISLFIHRARRPYLTSLTIVLSTCAAGVLLMAGLLRFFYGWVFFPIRDLQMGAVRVASGDFGRRIEVQSGDEMQDLAMAFNNMTDRLQDTYKDLHQQVDDRSRQLVRSERLASVGFLAAGVAHEINNPLASIAFCSEALESRVRDIARKETPDREVIIKYLKMIQTEAFRCKEITQRLLEFSRTGERKLERVDLAEVVRSVIEIAQHLQTSRGKRILFEPIKAVDAWVNAQEIKSVVLNLVVNALESMDEEGTLSIELGAWNGQALLVFEDTGCGMSQEVLDSIFEPFFTRSRTGKGTGLGLSISHRIVAQHGGEIEASSQGANTGSRFTVRLPIRPAGSVKEDQLGHAAA